MGFIYCQENGLMGNDFLQGIKDIIGSDPNVPKDQIDYKPFGGSFTNLDPQDDISYVSYCMTDKACGHFEAYSQKDVPLYLLDCNQFCYIDKISKKYESSKIYYPENPPEFYLNCGWETCGEN